MKIQNSLTVLKKMLMKNWHKQMKNLSQRAHLWNHPRKDVDVVAVSRKETIFGHKLRSGSITTGSAGVIPGVHQVGMREFPTPIF